MEPKRDLDLTNTGDFKTVREGDGCPRCSEGTLRFYRGIEIGHVFKLGTKYSDSMGATFLNASGQSESMIMGCYGIGVSRILSAVIEQHHDEHGIRWPLSIAPYQVHLIPVSTKDDLQMQAANELYQHLSAQGVEVLLDDRDERPGVKFKDADLIGIPLRIIIGRDIQQGNVEFVERLSNEKRVVPVNEAVMRIIEQVN